MHIEYNFCKRSPNEERYRGFGGRSRNYSSISKVVRLLGCRFNRGEGKELNYIKDGIRSVRERSIHLRNWLRNENFRRSYTSPIYRNRYPSAVLRDIGPENSFSDRVELCGMLDTSLQRNRLDCYKTRRENLKYQTEIRLESFIVCPRERHFPLNIEDISFCSTMDTRSVKLALKLILVLSYLIIRKYLRYIAYKAPIKFY